MFLRHTFNANWKHTTAYNCCSNAHTASRKWESRELSVKSFQETCTNSKVARWRTRYIYAFICMQSEWSKQNSIVNEQWALRVCAWNELTACEWDSRMATTLCFALLVSLHWNWVNVTVFMASSLSTLWAYAAPSDGQCSIETQYNNMLVAWNVGTLNVKHWFQAVSMLEWIFFSSSFFETKIICGMEKIVAFNKWMARYKKVHGRRNESHIILTAFQCCHKSILLILVFLFLFFFFRSCSLDPC